MHVPLLFVQSLACSRLKFIGGTSEDLQIPPLEACFMTLEIRSCKFPFTYNFTWSSDLDFTFGSGAVNRISLVFLHPSPNFEDRESNSETTSSPWLHSPDHSELFHCAITEVEMDVAVLRGRIVATLDADADVRRRAELDLKTVSPPCRPLRAMC
jgi:hypothetical protein